MEFIRKTSATVRAVSSTIVDLEIGSGECVSLSHVSHQVAGLLLAAGELDVEIRIRPKKGIALSSRTSGKDDTLIFPDLFISDTEVRINAQKIAIGDLGTETAPDTSDKSDVSADVQPTPDKAVVNDVVTEWRIKRDEAIAEGILAEFHRSFGVTGPNDAFVSAYRLMVGDIVPSANSATSETAPAEDAPADQPEETVVPSEEIEPAPVTEAAPPLATFDPKGTVTVSEPVAPAQVTTAPVDTAPVGAVTPATEAAAVAADSSDAPSAADTTPATTTDAGSDTTVDSQTTAHLDGQVSADVPVPASPVTVDPGTGSVIVSPVDNSVTASPAMTDAGADSVPEATIDSQVVAHLNDQVSSGVPVPTSLTSADPTAPATTGYIGAVPDSAAVAPVAAIPTAS